MRIIWIFILIKFSILYQQSFSVNKFLVKTKKNEMNRHYLVQSHSTHNRHKSSKKHQSGFKLCNILLHLLFSFLDHPSLPN